MARELRSGGWRAAAEARAPSPFKSRHDQRAVQQQQQHLNQATLPHGSAVSAKSETLAQAGNNFVALAHTPCKSTVGGGRLECELVPQHPLLLSPTTPRKHTAEVVTLERGGVETGLPKVAFVQRIPPQARREVSQQKDERGT